MPAKDPKALRRDAEAIGAKVEAITASAATMERDLSPEETAKVDGFLDQIEALNAEATAIEAEAKRQSRIQSLRREPEGDGQKAPATAIVEHVKARFEDDPKRGFAHARDFLSAVMQAPLTGSVDDRLRSLQGPREDQKIQATAGSDEQGVYSDPYGGFAVPEGFSPQLLTTPMEPDPIAGRTTMIPMAVPSIKIPARTDKDHSSSVSGGLTVARRAETDETASSRMQMEQIQLQATSLFGLAYVTEELLSDSAISFAAIIEAGFRDEFRSHMIDEYLNGSGVGQYEGIMNAPCTIQVAKETSPAQSAATVVYANVLKMRARCYGYGQAVWLANHNVLPQLAQMSLSVGTGGSVVWMPSAVPDAPDMLLGRPIFFTEYCKTLGTAGDIVLCNWSQYLEGLYEPIQGASSIHVRFVNHERTFKFWMRNAGACWWRSALTPKNGSTLSPFVTLATRS